MCLYFLVSNASYLKDESIRGVSISRIYFKLIETIEFFIMRSTLSVKVLYKLVYHSF